METPNEEITIYSMEELMEMMGGYEYYSPATYGYIYNKQHGNEDLAAECLKITLEEVKQTNEALNKTVKYPSGCLISGKASDFDDEESEKPVKIKKNKSSTR